MAKAVSRRVKPFRDGLLSRQKHVKGIAKNPKISVLRLLSSIL